MDSFDLSVYESVLNESEQQPEQPTEIPSSNLTEEVQESTIAEPVIVTEEANSTAEQAEKNGNDELETNTSVDITTEFDVDAIIASESTTSLPADFDVDAIIAAEAEGLESMTF